MNQLAINHGAKAVTLDYESLGNRPLVNEKGLADAVALLKKGEISQSPCVFAFEKRFADYVGAKHGLACNNGTATLFSALFACGVGPGDEVIVPSYTFWATLMPIISCHATPVFCDVDASTYCADPADIARKITKKTKAIMVVHVWGNPCDMDGVMAAAKQHGIKVIEDCSHAHGARFGGRPVGVIGDMGCFSLQGSKLLAGGEAGVLVTNNSRLYEAALALGHYDRLEALGDASAYRQYSLTGLGFKLRPSPIAIAVANAALDELEERNAMRNANALLLEEKIKDYPFLIAQKIYPNASRQFAYHYMTFDSTKLGGIKTITLLKVLSAEGLVCGYCGYGRLHFSPVVLQGGPYGDCGAHTKPVALPVTERLAQNTVMIAPRFENPCEELIEQYASALHKLADNLEELVAFDKANSFQAELKKLGGRSISII